MTSKDDPRWKQHEALLNAELQIMGRSVDALTPFGWGFFIGIFEHSDKPGGSFLYVTDSNIDDVCEALKEFIEKRGP